MKLGRGRVEAVEVFSLDVDELRRWVVIPLELELEGTTPTVKDPDLGPSWALNTNRSHGWMRLPLRSYLAKTCLSVLPRIAQQLPGRSRLERRLAGKNARPTRRRNVEAEIKVRGREYSVPEG